MSDIHHEPDHPHTNDVSDYSNGGERMAQAIEREIRRRQRLLRFYLALLAIPLVVGVVFLSFGRSDRQLVQDEVRAGVAPVHQRFEEIQPALNEVRDLGAVVPQVRQAATKLNQHDRQLVTVMSQQKSLADRIAPVEQSVREIQPVFAQVRELQTVFPEVRAQLPRHAERLTRLEREQAAIREGVRANENTLRELRAAIERRPTASGNLEELTGRVRGLDNRAATLEREQREIGTRLKSLEVKMEGVERSFSSLKQQLRRIEARLGSPTRPPGN
jgi:chromosome segregation ATPase